MGDEPGRERHHHSVHTAESGTVAPSRGGRRARLPRRPSRIRREDPLLLTGGEGVAAVYDGVGKESTFDGSSGKPGRPPVNAGALYGASSGPVPPVDPQRLGLPQVRTVPDSAVTPAYFQRTYDEFSARTGELFDAIKARTIAVTTGRR